MNCQQAETWIVELARDDGAADADALSHLDVCPRCAAQLRAGRAITADLRALAAHDAGASAPAHVAANLLVAFHAQMNDTPHTSAPVGLLEPVRSSWSSLFFSRRACAAFAVAALVLFTFAWLRVRFNAGAVRQTQTAETVAPVRAKEPTAATPNGSEPAAANRSGEVARNASGAEPPVKSPVRADERLLARTQRRPAAMRVRGRERAPELSVGSVGEMTVLAQANAPESVTEFMPLVAGNAPPLASGQLVRVEVSRSALAALGLPVDVTRAGETMKADVLLGEDGQARAIRLVR